MESAKKLVKTNGKPTATILDFLNHFRFVFFEKEQEMTEVVKNC